jgi:mannose-6-phosphate isomerase-like protein (cupin superfamily)
MIELTDMRTNGEKKPEVYDLDDYRHGTVERPADREVVTTADHKVNLWTLMPGQTTPLHAHPQSECLLIVMAGRGEYRPGGRSMEMTGGMMATTPPGVDHCIENTGSSPLVVVTVRGPGPFD